MNIVSISYFSRRLRAAVAGVSVVLLLTSSLRCVAESASSAPVYTGPVAAGMLEAPPRREASGLAASRRAPDVLWTHDDSGGAPVLYAVDTSGRKRGALRVRGVTNNDWEDVASFKQDSTAWLLIADTGDNDAGRSTVQLHVIAEPPPERLSPERELESAPAYSLRIKYEDGPRDCEGVAVDVAGKAIYLLTKRDSPPRLYRVPLGAAREAVVVAKLVGTVPALEGNSEMDAMLRMLVGHKAAWPTAMDFAADGLTAVVLTYGGVHVFTRRLDQSWPEALGGTPTRLAFSGLPQAEGACFSTDGRFIYVVSEGVADFVRYERESH